MNEIEKYIAWQLIEKQPKKMVVESLLDDDEGLKIFLRESLSLDNSRLLQVLFDPCISYRNMDESFRVSTFDNYSNGLNNTFYTVSNSIWLNWFHKESKNIYNDRDIIHFSIITIADCIDVLSEYPPDVSWIKEES